MTLAIGIDLGTTNSCVAVVRDGKARVVQDEVGTALHPSVVSFHPDGRVLVGGEAAERRVIDPQNTFYSVKRLIGRDFSDPDVRRVAERYPYTVVEGPKGIPLGQARGKEFTLPEISSMVLSHLREVSERMNQESVGGVVVTVPANFNDVQRSSTKVAGRIAGLDVQRILNEPTAAALAYGYGQGLNERVAVYDFGGGTFDITILDLRDNVFEVLATAGDMFLGGDDFDARLVDQMVASFLKLHHVDIRDNAIALQRLRGVAEQIKCQLSSRDQVSARIRELEYGPGGKPLDMNFAVTRDAFEQRVIDLVDRSFMVCDEAFRLATMSPPQLDNIILVGGSTRIPLIRQRVAEYFGQEPRADINPDEVVAIGAAIQAFALSGQTTTRTEAPSPQSPEELGRPIGSTPEQNELGLPGAAQPGMGDVRSTQRGMPAQTVPSSSPQPPSPGAYSTPSADPPSAFGGGIPEDLPAPRGNQSPPYQRGAGQSPASAWGGSIPDDLPAPQGAQPSGRPGAAAAFGGGIPDDLPAPRGAQPPPVPGVQGAGAASAFGGGIPEDLPAPRGQRTERGMGQGPTRAAPAQARSGTGAFGGGIPDDLPAPRGSQQDGGSGAAAAFGGGSIPDDLPAPRGSQQAGGQGAAGAFGGQLPEDLPAPRHGQPPPVPGAAGPGAAGQGAAAAFGGALPEDLPAPRHEQQQGGGPGAAAAFGGQLPEDLPAPRPAADQGASDLPVPRQAAPGSADLPVPRQGGPGSADLPVPQHEGYARADLPVPQGDGYENVDLPQSSGGAAAAFGGALPENLPARRGQFNFDGASTLGEGDSTGGQWSLESAAVTFTEESVIGTFTEEVKPPASIGRPPPGALGAPPPAAPGAAMGAAGAAMGAAGAGAAALVGAAMGAGADDGLDLPPTQTSSGFDSMPEPAAIPFDEGKEWDVLSVPGAPVPQVGPTDEGYVNSAVQLSQVQPMHPSAMAGVQAPGVAPLPSQLMNEFGVSHILIDVTPRALAVQTVQGYCDSVIERNSPIPIEQSRVFTTSRDDQDTVVIRICQGEARRVEENTVLGEIALTGIRPAARGDVKIAVTFEIDTDGIVSVAARDVDTGQQAGTRVTLFGGMSDDEVREIVRRYGK